jgi:acetoin utilization deacetylase AcuC-like enzyme
VILEGGYNLNSLAVSSMAVIRTLLTDSTNEEEVNKLLSDLAGK